MSSHTSMYIQPAMEEFLRAIRREPSRTLTQHLNVLTNALSIYDERSRERGELWAQFDEHDSFHHARSKLARIGAMLQDGSYKDKDKLEMIEMRSKLNDEILDLINYVVFLYRHVNPGWKPDVPRSEI